MRSLSLTSDIPQNLGQFLLLVVSIVMTVFGNHATFTLAPKSFIWTTGLLFLHLNFRSRRQRTAFKRDPFNPNPFTPYGTLCSWMLGFRGLLGAATWSVMCFFNAQRDSGPSVEQ